MTLPYVRRPEFMGPSKLLRFEQEPIQFYIENCGPADLAPARNEEQGFPAAVGTAFDAAVKIVVAAAAGIVRPSVGDLMEGIHTERDRACAFGLELVGRYADCGAMNALLADGPTHLDHKVEGVIAGVPCRGTLDARFGPVVHDWKVTGANRPGLTSPVKGYARFFRFDGAPQKRHKMYRENLEEMDEKWATQTAIYFMLLGLGGRCSVAIDQVLPGRGVAQYRTRVGEKYLKGIAKRLKAAWRAIEREAVVPDEIASGGLKVLRTMRGGRGY